MRENYSVHATPVTAKIKDYILLRCETVANNSAIAREVKKTFALTQGVDDLRRRIGRLREKHKLKAQQKDIKRLFFDIETSYLKGWFWRCGKQYMGPDKVMAEKKVICISYKWHLSDKVETLRWTKDQDDHQMIKRFVKIMGEADEIIAHNGDKFDIKELRTRAIKLGILMFPNYRTLDTLPKSRQYFSFYSNKLDYIARFLKLGQKMHHEGMEMWHKVVEDKCPKALDKMVKYCEQDVILLEDVYTAMSPYITHNNNFAVLTGCEKWECPECTSSNVKMYRTYTTAMGVVRRNMKCEDCNKQYRVSNRTYTQMLVATNE